MGFLSESLGLSENAFLILRNLIEEKTGLYFENDKKDILADKLTPRLITNGFSNFYDYYYKIKYDEDSNEEWAEIVNCLSINETYFWREYEHIDLLVRRIIPEHFIKNPKTPFTIWCAACSSGEEPISISIALKEAGYDNHPISIFATDASTNIISKAQTGLYRERAFRAIPINIKNKYFIKEKDLYRIKSEIHNKISWGVKNLKKPEELFPLNNSNVILCKNVFIYFSDNTIAKIVNNFYENMPEKSYLFVGISESLLKLRTQFELTEIDKSFVYRKI